MSCYCFISLVMEYWKRIPEAWIIKNTSMQNFRCVVPSYFVVLRVAMSMFGIRRQVNTYKRDKVFKSGLSKFYGKQDLKIYSVPNASSTHSLSVTMSVGLKVSYQFFSVSAHRIFLKFYMKLEGLKGQKLMEPNFSEKFSFWGKSPKIPIKWVFSFCQKFNPLMCLFLLQKWCTTVFCMMLQKLRVLEKSGSSVMA